MSQAAGKTVLITGGSRGIGAGVALRFGQLGCNLVLNYAKSDESMAAAEAMLKEAGIPSSQLLVIKGDVSQRHAVEHMINAGIARFGKLDILICNAGRNIDKPFMDLSDDNWHDVLNTIATGTFLCAQIFAKHFRGGGGHIITLGASTGIKGRKNGANYCAAKAAVITLTKCLALELAPRISVNCIVPGFIDTEEVLTRFELDREDRRQAILDTIPMHRLGTPDDVFKAMQFIIESTYLTGQNIYINGGNFMH